MPWAVARQWAKLEKQYKAAVQKGSEQNILPEEAESLVACEQSALTTMLSYEWVSITKT